MTLEELWWFHQSLIHEIGRFAGKLLSQLMVNVPITICSAQLQARSALCFISLIKSLIFPVLLEYFTVISLTF
jgi:hypothetical protein